MDFFDKCIQQIKGQTLRFGRRPECHYSGETLRQQKLPSGSETDEHIVQIVQPIQETVTRNRKSNWNNIRIHKIHNLNKFFFLKFSLKTATKKDTLELEITFPLQSADINQKSYICDEPMSVGI